MVVDEKWLAQVQETALEPTIPIIDAHHHLWDTDQSRYFFPELLEDAQSSGHNVVATVYVDCRSMYRTDGPVALRPVGETEFANGVAEMSASGQFGFLRACAGIVPTADLMLGAAVREVLEAHRGISPRRFRGIRYVTAWDGSPQVRASYNNPPPGAMRDAKFREGFAELGKLGLTYDAWLYHRQINELTDLAREFPDTTIVLDHFGGPLGIGPYEGRADEIFTSWRKAIDELATCPNVVAKLGGINMPINGFGWHKLPRPPTSEELAAATGRYYQHTIERFGPSRCMFESNFPVDKQSCSYTVIWNTFKRLTRSFSADEKAQLFYGTAKRVYCLDL